MCVLLSKLLRLHVYVSATVGSAQFATYTPSSGGSNSPGSGYNTAPPRSEHFSGDEANCRAFLVQCGLHFKLHPAALHSDTPRWLTFSPFCLDTEAKATAKWARNFSICQSLVLLMTSQLQAKTLLMP